MLDAELILTALLPTLNANAFTDLIFWTKSDLYRMTDSAVRRMARRAAGLVSKGTTAVVSGQPTYALPAATLSVAHVAVEQSSISPTSVALLDALDPDWGTRSARTVRQYMSQFQADSTIRLYPTPNTTSGNVESICHIAPAEVTPLAPSLDWPECLREYLIYAVLSEARSDETDGAMPEVRGFCKQMAALYEQAALAYWGPVQ